MLERGGLRWRCRQHWHLASNHVLRPELQGCPGNAIGILRVGGKHREIRFGFPVCDVPVQVTVFEEPMRCNSKGLLLTWYAHVCCAVQRSRKLHGCVNRSAALSSLTIVKVPSFCAWIGLRLISNRARLADQLGSLDLTESHKIACQRPSVQQTPVTKLPTCARPIGGYGAC